MLHRFLRPGRFMAVFLLGALLLAACGGTSTNTGTGTTPTTAAQQPTPTPAVGATVTIPQGHDLFSPFIVAVQPGTKVIWQNSDSSAHTIMTTSDHNTFLNPQSFSLNAAAGQQASFTFTTPGVYDYYDNTAATWNTDHNRVAANKGVPDFPLAMEGVVWVQGAISGLSSSASNSMPGMDIYTTDFQAIAQGGTVSWMNTDGEEHFVALVPGWSSPINPATLGTLSVPGQGGKQSFTFQQPGLYYYYCPAHAQISTTWNRAETRGPNAVYPLPMEGFILVAGS